MTIDVEAESDALRQRSAELVALLDAGVPVVDRTSTRAVQEEAAELARAAHRARADVAKKVAAGQDPGVPMSKIPPIRRIASTRNGRDPDAVLRGRSVITPELVAYFEHQRDTVAPATEDMYRQAVADRPYQAALVAAVRGHLALLGQRQNVESEGGEALTVALRRYDDAYSAIRENINDAHMIATVAIGRLTSIERERAAAVLGDDETTVLVGLIAAEQGIESAQKMLDADGGVSIGVTETAVQ